MIRQQSSSAAFSIITASPGEEWIARTNDRSRNYIRKNAETTVSQTSLIALHKELKLRQAEIYNVAGKIMILRINNTFIQTWISNSECFF